MGNTTKITALILTFNEEKHIEDCLRSVAWCDQIIIVDSGSSDKTEEICKRYTDLFIRNKFINFSLQRNFALSLDIIRNKWVLFLDADERITPELEKEIKERLSSDPNYISGYYIPRKQYFWGKWLRHGEAWPCYEVRLFVKDKGRYTHKDVHEDLKLEGKIAKMNSPLIHISRESMSEVLKGIDRYSTLEAIRMYKTGEELYVCSSKSPSKINHVMKRIFKYLPFKPFWKFTLDYFIWRGFLDGYEGFSWAVIQAFYVWISYFKLWELKRGIVKLPDEICDE
jgi:glycosyltransferase involved in cell wall biosynthesis